MENEERAQSNIENNLEPDQQQQLDVKLKNEKKA